MTKQKKVVAVVSLLSIWLLNGCAAVIVGAGVGAGAYTYVKGRILEKRGVTAVPQLYRRKAKGVAGCWSLVGTEVDPTQR